MRASAVRQLGDSRSGREHAPEPERPAPASGRRILLVEDDTSLREAVSVLLADEGYDVETAPDGLSALELLRRSSDIGLIILDVRMPVMDGWEFRLAQRSDARLSAIPVIAASADGSPQAMAIDADLHFRKPYDPQQLLAGVERLLWQSERRGMQARLDEAERLASLGRVAAGVGHEINNPLAYVTLNVEALREALMQARRQAKRDEQRAAAWRAAGSASAGPLGTPEPASRGGNLDTAHIDQLLEILGDCETGLERIREVVSNLRSLSRQNEGSGAMLALDEVLDGAGAMVLNQVQQRAVLVRAYEKLPRIFGHPGRLGQVFVNLLVNAAQSIPEGQQSRNKITVFAQTSADGTKVVVEIRDTGRGIPSDVLPHIFEPFFTTRHQQDGTGLGLSISRQIVLAHGGDLEVESRLGQGTVARVTLPLPPLPEHAAPQARSSSPASPASPPPPASPAPASEGPVATPGSTPALVPAPARGRVLILDDDPLVARALSSLLRREHEVVEKQRALEALDLLRQGEAFDVILCDLLMPDMDGAAFCEALSQTVPHQAERLVFMTGGAFTPRTSHFVETVKYPVISKPFDAVKLRALVRQMVAEQHAQRRGEAHAEKPSQDTSVTEPGKPAS